MFEVIDVHERKGNRFDDLTGRRFGKLTVIGLSGKKAGRKSYWVCQCDCGNKHLVRSDSLKCGNVQSCGCLKVIQDNINLRRITHGDTVGGENRLHMTWQGMKQRTTNPNNTSFNRYGGRGITVCDDWLDYEKFKSWALSHGYNDALTIERIDVNDMYCPENCIWIPAKQQATNRRSTVWIEWNGEIKNIKQWSDALGINYGTLHSRYYRSDMRPPELFEPVKNKKIPR